MRTVIISLAALLALFFVGSCAPSNVSVPAPSAAEPDPGGIDFLCEQIFATYDNDKDGKIGPDEYAHGVIVTFHEIDRNGDLKLDASELSGQWDAEAQAVDFNRDGFLTLSEILKHQAESFKQRDVDKCGFLTQKDVRFWVTSKIAEQQEYGLSGNPLPPK